MTPNSPFLPISKLKYFASNLPILQINFGRGEKNGIRLLRMTAEQPDHSDLYKSVQCPCNLIPTTNAMFMH